jgi:hypothetical protein
MGWNVLLWGPVNVLQKETDGEGVKKIGESADIVYGQTLNSTKVVTFLVILKFVFQAQRPSSGCSNKCCTGLHV